LYSNAGEFHNQEVNSNMHQLIESTETFAIWRKALELADTIQKMADNLTSPESLDIRSIFKTMTSTIPSHIVEGFMMHNTKDRKTYFYRTLSCLEELLNNIRLTQQMGFLKKAHIRKLRKEIIKLNGLICEFISPQGLLLN
jgi:four helix bundle protein